MLKTDTGQVNWRRANPGKYEAHLALQRAVKAVDLKEESCEVCGVEAVDAHHDQYDEPFAREMIMPSPPYAASSLW